VQELDGRGGGGACSGAAAVEGSASRLAGAGLGGEATAFRDVSRAFVPIRACSLAMLLNRNELEENLVSLVGAVVVPEF